ncbi:Protein of unknown function [Propionibacterium freudenreichii]|nr:Protein of unknown function [Propionibacterium freudenreichii]
MLARTWATLCEGEP